MLVLFRIVYPFFYLSAKELKGISGTSHKYPADNACPEALVRRLLWQSSDILSCELNFDIFDNYQLLMKLDPIKKRTKNKAGKGLKNRQAINCDKENKEKKYPIYFFVHGDKYKLWNIFSSDIHLLGVKKPGVLFLFGTDKLGRDLFSRILYAARISLSIGLVGVTFSFILGCILGGVSGFYGGAADMIIQRVVEFLICIPTIPLWMALAAAVPRNWPLIKTYFSITIILSIVSWCGLARVVRGKLISSREEDFAIAAKIAGATDGRIITKHLLPSFLSYLIVSLTLAIPGMILGETALSFLGLGLRPPVVSWGVLLNEAQDVKTVIMNPWLLFPGIFVIITVLAFNFLGDGLRDAADPYK